MRFLLALLLFGLTLSASAEDYLKLYQAAGWPEQREHFTQALDAAQQRYRNTLPPALFQALVDNSNRRFASTAIDQRALRSLRQQLADPQPALTFFRSELGQRVVAAEQLATRKDQLAKYASGLPRTEAEATRRLLIRHLAQALPAKEAGAEVSLALASVAADSLSQMIPGLPGGGLAHGLLESQRQRLIEQLEPDLDNTLLHVYRELSDAELEQFVEFARSEAGQAYYRAALAALRAGLAVGASSTELEPPASSI